MARSSDAKSELNPELVFSKMAWGNGWTIIRALKSLKKCTLIGFFCQKHIMFQLENFRENMLWHWRVMQNLKKNDSWLEKWVFGWFSCEMSKTWKFALWWASFVQSIWRFRWKITEELCLMTLKSDAKVWRKTECWFQKWHEEFGEF